MAADALLPLMLLTVAVTTTADALPEYPKPPAPTAVAAAGSAAAALGLNAKDFGAVGDGQTDDTRALQKAIDASQMAGRALLIPAGVYLVSSTLNISCRSPPLCDPEKYSHSESTHQPARIIGEGRELTYLMPSANIRAILDITGSQLPMKTPTSQPHFNFTSGHEIMDLTLQCNSAVDPTSSRSSRLTGGGAARLGQVAPLPQKGPVPLGTPCKYVFDRDCHNVTCEPCGANYGIWAPGALETIYTRLHVTGAAIAGFKAFYGYAVRFIDCNFDTCTIAIHAAITELRITGGNFYSNGNTAILIDGGDNQVVDNNVIEGTNGPAIIVSGGIWGAPFGISFTNNNFVANNLRPGWWISDNDYQRSWRHDGHRGNYTGARTLICTEMLLTGQPWNQSFVDRPKHQLGPDAPIGILGKDYPPAGISYSSNSGVPPGSGPGGKDGVSPCTEYAAVTAVATTGLRIVSTHQTQEWPSNTKSGALLRLFADGAMSAVSDIVFEANGGQVPKFKSPGQFYGWENWIALTGANESIGPDYGEMAFFTFFSPEVPQHNFYSPESVGRPAVPRWSVQDSALPELKFTPVSPGRNARATINVGGQGTAGGAAVIAEFDLENNPDLATQPVYLAFEAALSVPGSRLSLMIDIGDGQWQFSNSSKGLSCPDSLGFGCEGVTANATDGRFHMRSYQATLGATGWARFGLQLSAGNATISGLVIARIGAMWHSL